MIFKCVLEVNKDKNGAMLKDCIERLNKIPDELNKSVKPLNETKEKIVFILVLEGEEINVDEIKESLKNYIKLCMEIPSEATV